MSANTTYTATTIWVPGHVKIEGNTLADMQASTLPDPPSTLHNTHNLLIQQKVIVPPSASLAGAARWATMRLAKELAAHWQNQFNRHWQFCYNFPTIPHRALSLPRNQLAHLLAERSGHGNFAGYPDRFGHTNAPCKCNCRSERALGHFFNRPLLRR